MSATTEYLSLSEAARLVPGRPHTATLTRWCRPGIKARTGERVRLKHWRIGRRIYTTREALDEFFERTADADARHFSERETTRPEPPDRTAVKRAQAVEQAKREALK